VIWVIWVMAMVSTTTHEEEEEEGIIIENASWFVEATRGAYCLHCEVRRCGGHDDIEGEIFFLLRPVDYMSYHM
jgi:hypothetical protein